MGSRRHLNIRGKSANLPAITERDWKDIEFGVKMNVDFYALSFVRDADCIYELQEYLRSKGSTAKVRTHCSCESMMPRQLAVADSC
jgi:pyruvate kinase